MWMFRFVDKRFNDNWEQSRWACCVCYIILVDCASPLAFCHAYESHHMHWTVILALNIIVDRSLLVEYNETIIA